MAYTTNCPCGKRLIVALHNVRGQCPCGKRLIVALSPVTILGKGFVVTFFGWRLVVALLNGCILLGVLVILDLGNVHAVFGILTVPSLGIFALLVVVWRDMVTVASCKQQHEHLIVEWEPLRSSLAFVFLLSLLLVIQQKVMIVTSLMFISWHCDQSYCWCLALLQFSMRLIHNEKCWLLLAQSAAFVAINGCCHALQQ
jgi:hypothetical protein